MVQLPGTLFELCVCVKLGIVSEVCVRSLTFGTAAWCRTPLIASAAANAVNLSLDLFFVFVAGWGVVGAATAATVGQYVGLATMLCMLCWKGVLRLSDLKSLPSLRELAPMAQVR